ncbi:hypothetical protein EsH8_III_001378 [Colletotrichum jinshuiense]
MCSSSSCFHAYQPPDQWSVSWKTLPNYGSTARHPLCDRSILQYQTTSLPEWTRQGISIIPLKYEKTWDSSPVWGSRSKPDEYIKQASCVPGDLKTVVDSQKRLQDRAQSLNLQAIMEGSSDQTAQPSIFVFSNRRDIKPLDAIFNNDLLDWI